MSTPPTWSPQPPDDRWAAAPAWVPAPESAPIDPFHAPQHAAPQYGTPQYAPPQYTAQGYPAGQYAAGQPSADPYGPPAPGSDRGAPQYAYAYGPGNTYAAQRTSGLAIASLVTSLASFLLPITAPVGMVLGIVALNGIKRDGTQGRGLAIGGIAVGAVMTVTLVVGVLAFAAFWAAVPSAAFTT